MMKTTKNNIVVLALFLLAHLSIYAQYSGGDSEGSSSDMLGITSCPTPAHFYAYFGGVNEGSGSETISNTTCGFSNHFYAYLGGSGEGSGTEQIDQTACGIPAHFYAYFGGENDGAAVETISAVTCGFPPQFYAYFGGEGDGYSLDKTAPICPTAPPVADFTASATAVCIGQSVTFTDTSTNIPSAWTWTMPGATPNSSTDQNPTVVYNTAGTYAVTLVAANFNGADTEAKTGYITVTAIPTVNATTPGSRCDAGIVTLGATATSGTLNWYNVATGGSSLGTGTSFATPSISTTTTYYVESVSGTCTSPRIAVIATVNTTPTITSTTPASRCDAGNVTLSATASAGTLNWYAAAVGGLSLTTGANFTASGTFGITTYYVDATATGCTSPRTAVNVTVNATPTITGTTPAGRCDAGTVALSATASTGTLSWFAASTGGLSLGSGTTFTTPSIGTTTTYYVETATATCTSPRTAVTATVTPTPTVSSTTPANRCDAGIVTLNATASAGNVVWYDAATGGTPLATTNNYVTPNISSTTTYYVEAVNGTCVSSRTAVIATVNTTPTVTATTPGDRCGAGSVALSATASAGTLNWYNAATGGSFLGSGANFNTPAIGATATFYVEAATASCTSTRTAVVATVNTIPTIMTTTPNSRCDAGTLILGATASAGTISWYDVPTGGVALTTGTSYTTPSISTTTTYYVETTNATCTSTRTAVIASINPTAAPTGSFSQTFCVGETVGLLAVNGSNIVWYDAPIAGNVVPDNTPLATGTTYYASQTVTSCESPIRLAVSVSIGTCLGTETFEQNQLQLYPNPTTDMINISYTKMISKVEVYNMLGQHIQSKNINANNTKIDMVSYATGTYLVKVFIDNQIKTYKVIKR